MRDLMEKGFGPNDVFVATGGYGTKALQRDWIKRGLFNAPVGEPRAGKPRDFPYLAVMEAALMAEAARRRISVSTVSAAVRWRLFEAADSEGIGDRIRANDGQFTEGDITQVASHFPEFDETQIDMESTEGVKYTWVIVHEWFFPELPKETTGVEADTNRRNDISEDLMFVRVVKSGDSQLSDIFPSPATIVLNISTILTLCEIRKVLHQKGKISY